MNTPVKMQNLQCLIKSVNWVAVLLNTENDFFPQKLLGTEKDWFQCKSKSALGVTKFQATVPISTLSALIHGKFISCEGFVLFAHV